MSKVKTGFSYLTWALSITIILKGLGAFGRDLETWRQERKLRK